MDIDEFLEKLTGNDLLKKHTKVERLKLDKNPGGLAKITMYATRLDEHGTEERLSYVQDSILSCGHVGPVAAVCGCGAATTFCKICSSSSDNRCSVCSEVMCEVCRAKSLFHNKAKYHKKCKWKFILSRMFKR